VPFSSLVNVTFFFFIKFAHNPFSKAAFGAAILAPSLFTAEFFEDFLTSDFFAAFFNFFVMLN
jgi:hypothetical protein